MSKRGVWARYESFRGGQVSDIPAHLIPDDSMLFAENVVTNKIGRAAKRGPVQPYMRDYVQANIDQVGVTKLTVGSSLPQGVGVSVIDQGWYTFPLPTSASPRSNFLGSRQPFTGAGREINLSSSNSPVFGPSFNSFGLTGFPLSSGNANVTTPFIFFSTANDSDKSYSSTGVCTLTAGKNTIGIPALAISKVSLGSFIYISKYAGSGNTTNEYVGYITAVGTSTVDVYPAPATSFTTTSTGIIQVSPYQSIIRNIAAPSGNTTLCESGGGVIPQSSSFACVHQNRLVLCTQAENTVDVGGTLNDYARTRGNIISWSAITGEPATASNTGADGILSMLPAGWPKGQRLTLDTAKVVALVSMDANNLMVLCVDKVLMISGTLGTVVPAAGVNTSSFSVRTVAPDIGCIDEDSVQRTPYGIMFASRNGVYLTDGTTFTNVMVNKVQGEWNVYQYDQANFVCGSAVLGDTHYVLFTAKGPHFICDMTNDFAWTRISVKPDLDGATYNNFDYQFTATATPATTSYTMGAKYFNNTAGTGLGSGFVVGSVALGGDLWVHPTTAAGGTLTQITGVTTDTTTATPRDIGVDGSCTRIANFNVVAGVASLRVYTVSGYVATLEQNLTPPAGKTFSTQCRVDMDASGSTIVVATNDGHVVYKRVGTTWTAETAVVSFNPCTVAISGDGQTIAVADNNIGATPSISIYRKSGGVFVFSVSLVTETTGSTNRIRSGNKNVSLSYNGNYLAALGAISTTGTNKGYFWNYSGSSWSAVTKQNFAATSLAVYSGLSINNSGYFIGGSYNATGIMANVGSCYFGKYNPVAGSCSFPVYTIPGKAELSPMYLSAMTLGWSQDQNTFGIYRTPSSGTGLVGSLSSIAFPRSTYQSYGVGVRDWSGSGEVYAARYGGPVNSLRNDAVVLLDSILSTDSPITTSAIGFNQLVDAGTTEAFNATIETKSYTIDDASTLKSFKTFMFSYSADAKTDATDPIDVWSAEGLEPEFNLSLAPKFTAAATPSATPSVPATKTTRYSIYPRAIDAGVGFAFKTDYVAGDSTSGSGQFQLYDVGINAVDLRKGRTFQ